MRIHVAKHVANMWLAGYTFTEAMNDPEVKRCDEFQHHALTQLWSRFEWAHDFNCMVIGAAKENPCDVTHRMIRDRKNG